MNIPDLYNPWNVFNQRYQDIKRRTGGKTKRHYHSSELGEIATKYEFIGWCFDHLQEYDIIFEEWEDNNFVKRLSPSIDRIDSNKTYTLDNIQWLSLSDNARKHNKTID